MTARMADDASPAFEDELLAMLDALLEVDGPTGGWERFYDNRARPCPFFVDVPDESLAAWVEAGWLAPGRALDLGCGNGRNSVFLARHGFAVEGVDLSAKAVAWAREQAAQAGVNVTLHTRSVFDLELAPGAYDLVYDSGCFHHIAPHRRPGYVQRVATLLKPGGHFGLTCFRPEGGSALTDLQVYQRRSLGGGLGYTEAQLRVFWSPGLDIEELRPMRDHAAGSVRFGRDFLWVMRARKPA